MASKKSKILAIAFCAAVMAGIHVNPVLAYHGEEDFNYQHNTTESGLNNPEIHHTADEGWVRPDWEPVHPEGDVNCEEEVANSNITVGDMNKVTADLVANDEKIYSDVKDLQEQVNNIETTADTDTHVKEGAATVADNGDVTMDIVDKSGNDTGKDVTITGLASDGELAAESAAREEADAGLQYQIDGHTNQISSMGNQLDDLKANDELQDGTLANHQEQLDEHKGAIDSLNGDVSGLIANDAVQDETLADHQEQLDEHKGAIDSLNGEVSGLIANDAVQDETLADHQEQLDDHSQQLDAVRGEISEEHRVNGEQNEILADHQEQLDDHSQQLDAVRGEISEEHRVNGEQNDRLDAHDISIKNHEAVMGVTDKTGLESAYEGATYIDKNDTMVEADRKLDAAISDVNTRVDGIENRVDGLEDRIDKVGAMSAAIANLRTMGYDPAAPTEVAVGVGQYRDETGMALGLFHYPNRDFMLSLSVSTSGDEYMGGIGATWKFGRKSPEKVAEIKKAQAEADARRAEEQKLAKAEEMKKAAKEAKVQAQMERHAKMLAEQEAQA